MKNYLLVINLILIFLTSSSCTVLQWRESNQEIQEKFKDLKINNEISYFKVDSLKLNTRTLSIVSNKKNANVIFLHGSPSSLSAWQSYYKDASLAKIANIYAIDRPGYGYSNFGKEVTSIKTQAQIISAIINEKKLSNVIIIGASFGGPIAARVGFLNDKVKGVIMVSPAIDPNIEKDVWGSRLTQWFLTRWMVPTAYRVAGDEKTVHAKELELIEADWGTINIPITHIHGDNDDLVPYENINFSKKNFQNLKIVSVPNRGHEISWKNPELITPHIIELINKIQKK